MAPLVQREEKVVKEKEEELSKEQGKTFLGIRLKKETTRWNVFAIFLTYFLHSSIGGYVNAQTVYLLRDPELFGISSDHQGRVTSTILLLAIFVGMIWSFLAGPIYDLCLRKVPMTLAVVLGSFFMGVCP